MCFFGSCSPIRDSVYEHEMNENNSLNAMIRNRDSILAGVSPVFHTDWVWWWVLLGIKPQRSFSCTVRRLLNSSVLGERPKKQQTISDSGTALGFRCLFQTQPAMIHLYICDELRVQLCHPVYRLAIHHWQMKFGDPPPVALILSDDSHLFIYFLPLQGSYNAGNFYFSRLIFCFRSSPET